VVVVVGMAVRNENEEENDKVFRDTAEENYTINGNFHIISELNRNDSVRWLDVL
jgi:hypothetical protein